jgi:hypothetical protein
LKLRERTFHCDSCGLIIGRDVNAARNVLYIGASMYTTLVTISRVPQKTRRHA